MKRYYKWFIIVGAILLACLLAFALDDVVRTLNDEMRIVRGQLEGASFDLLVADTNELRLQGLGGRPQLEPGEGMLFVFDKPDFECFWMKDVDYAIDILWFDADKRLVHVEDSVAPDTYPASFCPSEPAQYAVELLEGQAEALGVSGETVLDVPNL
ncbi:MAG: DUF192 domain-containing protein [Candidatus Saccharibacteria bacterium]|nr:DUF192 domain-containing protein [Candidatus Saccharibacteria bacterium]